MTWRGEKGDPFEPGQLTIWGDVTHAMWFNRYGAYTYGHWCAWKAEAVGGHIRRRIENGVELIAVFEGREEKIVT